jgi:hypothetical protein
MHDCGDCFLITKEDLIVLRLLYLQSRDKDLQKLRLSIPYENIVLSFDPDYFEGFKALEFLEWILPARCGQQVPIPPDLELIIKPGSTVWFENDDNGVPNNVYVGIPWSYCTCSFENNLKTEEVKKGLFSRIYNTISFKKMAYMGIITGSSYYEYKSHDFSEKEVYQEWLEKTKKCSKDRLIKLMLEGLWHKKFHNYNEAIPFFERAYKIQLDILYSFIKHTNANEDFQWAIITDSDKCLYLDDSDEDAKHIKWLQPLISSIDIPFELLLTIEESPAFQLGEIFLAEATEKHRNNDTIGATRLAKKALYYFNSSGRYWRFQYTHPNQEIMEKINSPQGIEYLVEQIGPTLIENISDDQRRIIFASFDKQRFYLNMRPYIKSAYLETNIERVNQLLKIRPEYGEVDSKVDKDIKEIDVALKDIHILGEGELIEFKETLLWDKRTKQKNNDLADKVVEALAAFMNSKGGRIYIGVADDGQVIGLKNDLKIVRGKNIDGFKLELRNAIERHLDLTLIDYLEVKFIPIREKIICKIIGWPSKKPIYYKDEENEDIYIRVLSSSNRLNTRKAGEYIKNHWPNL